MPGGGGGIVGQLMNSVTRNLGGGSGMGGGMSQMNMGGGMSQMNMGGNANAAQTETVTDQYDIDRWKRSDEDMSMVQQVRTHWQTEQDLKAEQKLSVRIKKFIAEKKSARKNKRPPSRRKNYAETQYATHEQDTSAELNNNMTENNSRGGTIDLKSSKLAQEKKEKEEVMRLQRRTRLRLKSANNKNFFNDNPVNSDILSIDILSMGPLTLNQIESISGGKKESSERNIAYGHGNRHGEKHIAAPVYDEAQNDLNRPDSPPNGRRRMVTFDSGYMDSIKDERENQKYNVKML